MGAEEQDGTFQLGQVLLEGFHLLRSTVGKGEDIKCKRNIFLSAVIVKRDFLHLLAIKCQ